LPVMLRRICLILLTTTVATVNGADQPETDPSRVVLLPGPVDQAPDPGLANLVRVDFVGCKTLVDRHCGRLAHFRLEYGWEPAQQVELRLREGTSGTVVWLPLATDSRARAGLPLPPDPTGMNLLHVRLKESGWDWFTFPGPHHPGTLPGAGAFEVQPGGRNVRVTLVMATGTPEL
jgi:hypothetical protein